MNIKEYFDKLPKSVVFGLALLVIWEIILIFQGAKWINFLLLISGAAVGYLIMEIDWAFPNDQIKRFLPLILLPVTLFILTSTGEILGKSIVVFLNLRLIVDQFYPEDKNENKDRRK